MKTVNFYIGKKLQNPTPINVDKNYIVGEVLTFSPSFEIIPEGNYSVVKVTDGKDSHQDIELKKV